MQHADSADSADNADRADSTDSADSADSAGRPELRRLLDRAVTRGGVPGVVVEVRECGQVWRAAAGVADTATGRERTIADRFRIGSITKPFVATVVLQLAAEGRIGLDDPLAAQLPCPGVESAAGATVRELLNHTSGVPSHTDDPAALNAHATHPPATLLRVAAARPRAFAPGAGWAYSNTNYVLAGLLVEHVTGRTLAAEVDRRISRPLGLTGTRLPSAADHGLPAPHARHYTKLFRTDPDAPVLDATTLDPAPFWASGDMVSTVGDLNRFLAALLAGRLLPPDRQRDLLLTVPTRDWLPGAAYGLGVCALPLPGGTGTRWGMGGATIGSWTYAFATPDGSRLLAVNTNADWTDPASGWADPIGLFTELLETALAD
ncbi:MULTISPECIES: serine hydrolase domain-containing protein [Kitasatospora]|uniref:Putative beta-lactamase n=1 Tax=Kitasatospora setae (strain ATCC 33774 / DSM 43861 / JCM 3304 / KCC A-0304 / NBRC 14216 / KM-6054) TaxID=452652 RepID=E4N4C9_KITSK|nr:serine hydrolase domain-containing protein [Kitasatospora setae]BAJ26060.1 putative beta-lactamase [Kitasatospora setae KM-6054]